MSKILPPSAHGLSPVPRDAGGVLMHADNRRNFASRGGT
jgi:hypothetical protein